MHAGQEVEVCRQFAKGNCHRGGNCRFRHISPAPQDKSGRTDARKCNHCGKAGHIAKDCYRKKREDKEKSEAEAHSVQDEAKQQEIDEAHATAAAITVDSYAFAAFDIVATNVTPSLTKALGASPHSSMTSSNTLLMVIDGAATVGVVQDERHCIDIKPCDVYIKTGGKGKPTLVHCTKTGVLKASTKIDGKTIELRVPVRIVPGFGVDILPECFFLQKRFAVNKLHTKLEVWTPKPNSVLVLTGDALKYEQHLAVLLGAARRLHA